MLVRITPLLARQEVSLCAAMCVDAVSAGARIAFFQKEQFVMTHDVPKFDVAGSITRLITEKLEAGVLPWVRPWTGTPPSQPLRSCGTPYRGINLFVLWTIAHNNGFASPYWLTYRQASLLGGQVRKGEKCVHAIFYKSLGTDQDSEGSESEADRGTARRVLRSYAIFNADQIDDLPAHYHPPVTSACPEPDQHESEVQAWFEALPATVIHGGDHACYNGARDEIHLPVQAVFRSYVDYASTRAHETLHWSGGRARLNREFGKRLADKAYAFEELVATMGEALLCAKLGLPAALHDDHAAYIADWLTILGSDRSAILTAAAKADEACTYLEGLVSDQKGSTQTTANNPVHSCAQAA